MSELKGIDVVCIFNLIYGNYLINPAGGIRVSAYEIKIDNGLSYVRPIHDLSYITMENSQL